MESNPLWITSGISKKKVEPGGHGTQYFNNKKMRQSFGQEVTDYKKIIIQESLDKCEKFIRNKKEWRGFLEKHSSKDTKGSLTINHTNGKHYQLTSESLLDYEGRPWGRMAIVKEVGHKRRKDDN